jgi:hypothetical protein
VCEAIIARPHGLVSAGAVMTRAVDLPFRWPGQLIFMALALMGGT